MFYMGVIHCILKSMAVNRPVICQIQCTSNTFAVTAHGDYSTVITYKKSHFITISNLSFNAQYMMRWPQQECI
jgi:hypothetical protein